jgi:SPP1 family predicted phage head-tail adaptor
MYIRSRELRHRVLFQTRSISKDTFGGQSSTWTDAFTVFAAMESSFGKELLTAQGMSIDQPITVTVRYRTELAIPPITAAMRIVYGTRIFNIHSSVNQIERNRAIVLICSEGMNNG